MEPSTRRNPSLALVPLLLLGAVTSFSPAVCQEPAVPGLDVPLVQLDVMVRDAHGEPVTDLSQDDFALFQDRHRLPLAGFSSPEGARAGTTASGSDGVHPASDATPLHLVLCVHLQFLESGDLTGLREVLAGFLHDELPPDARVLLARMNPEIEILEGFTTDRERILARVDELTAQQGVSRLNTEYASVLREILEQSRKPFRDSGAEVRDAIPKALLTRIGAVAEQAYREMVVATTGLARLALPLAGLPGRKEVLLVSGRLPAQAGDSLLGSWRRAFDRSSSYWGDGRVTENPGIEFDSLPEATAFLDTGRLIQELTAFATARGVEIHTLDVSSGRETRVAEIQSDPTGQNRRAAARRTRGDRQSLTRLAEATGGRALAGPSPAESFSVLARDLRSRYTLAFEPPQGADGALHEIDVRLPGHHRLDVHHMPSYRARSRDQETAERLVSALLLDAHGGAPASNPLAAVVETQVTPAIETRALEEAGPQTLRAAVRVPLANLALIPQGHSHLGQLSIFSAAGAAGTDDEMPEVSKSVVPVRIPNEELLTSQGRQIESFVEVPWRPGMRRLVLGVRDDFQTVTSMLVVPIDEANERAAMPGSEAGARSVVGARSVAGP